MLSTPDVAPPANTDPSRGDRRPGTSRDWTLLAEDRRPFAGLLPIAAPVDQLREGPTRRGVVARRYGAHLARRAEPGPEGPVLLEAVVHRGDLVCRVYGATATPADHVEWALWALRAWTGQLDHPRDLDEVVGGNPLLRRTLLRLGEVRLGRIPRVFEAAGRAILHQLVQRAEAARSVAQIVQRFGTPARDGLAAWPAAAALGAVPAWELRRCGVSLRGARSLHAAAVHEGRLQEVVPACSDSSAYTTLDARLRALPGVGMWTSAETRLALGDPDAVSVGDYNLHGWVTHALAGVDPRSSSDELMLELLRPFAPQRGRVVTLITRALHLGLLRPPPRRAPHRPLSAHRYW